LEMGVSQEWFAQAGLHPPTLSFPSS
jgi:hypothetical protein